MRKKKTRSPARQIVHNENGCRGQIKVAKTEDGAVVFFCADCIQIWESVYTKVIFPKNWGTVDEKKDAIRLLEKK